MIVNENRVPEGVRRGNFIKNCLIALLLAGLLNVVQAHEPQYSDGMDFHHLLQAYSERTGVKFVVDPRVKGRVNMIGLSEDDLSQTNLVDILRLHNFAALEKDGIVYVLPQAVAESFGAKLGSVWEE